jgi:uncharacterized protein (TIGR03000 family)
MALRARWLLPVLALSIAAVPGLAWDFGRPVYQDRFPYPPSWYGYNLDDPHPGYFGGGRYTQYYGYGRGYGFADYPGPVPDYRYLGWPRYYRAVPVQALAAPSVTALTEAPASLEVHVPADAEIWVGGDKSTQSGTIRWFRSQPLAPGQSYTYELRVRWKQDGRTVEQFEVGTLQAGGHSSVRFQSDASTEAPPQPGPFPLDSLP